MWVKEYYQEQLLGYLDWMQTEIERLQQIGIRQNDIDELYDDLDIAIERLWRLIEPTEVDWEKFRYPVEVSCDTLLHMFYRTPYASYLIHLAPVTITENHEKHLYY